MHRLHGVAAICVQAGAPGGLRHLLVSRTINIIGIKTHGFHMLSLFLPSGAPIALAPLLVMIELVSYSFRVVSLALRLFANMMSGHCLLKILAGFA